MYLEAEGIQVNTENSPIPRSHQPAGEDLSIPRTHQPAGEHLSIPRSHQPVGEHLSIPRSHQPAGEHLSISISHQPGSEHLSIPRSHQPASEPLFIPRSHQPGGEQLPIPRSHQPESEHPSIPRSHQPGGEYAFANETDVNIWNSHDQRQLFSSPRDLSSLNPRASEWYVTYEHRSRDDLNKRPANPYHKPTAKPISCQVCSGDHRMSRCEVFKQKSIPERLNFVRAKALCDNCFQIGHLARSSPQGSYCTVTDCKIKRKHSTCLHMKNLQSTSQRENTESSKQSVERKVEEPRAPPEIPNNEVKNGAVCSSTGAGMAVVGLAIVPVRVNAKGQDRFIETYAFLDPGSNTSFCTEDLINGLEVNGRETVLSLTTMDSENVKSKSLVASLEVSDIEGRNVIDLPMVFSRTKLPVTKEDIPSQGDIDRWPYLGGVRLPRIDANVDILIGNGVPKALEPKELRESEDGGPSAVRTLLEWTINGPLGRNGYSTRTVNRLHADNELNYQFGRFCEMEFNDLKNNTVKAMSQEDKRALSQMEQSINLMMVTMKYPFLGRFFLRNVQTTN